MSDVNRNVLREILEGEFVPNINLTTADAKTADRDNFAKMKTAYNSCKDEAAIASVGVAPLRVILDELEKHYPATPRSNVNAGNDELTNALIWLAKNSVSGLVSISVTVSSFPNFQISS
jgi:endothelin-converting enzyme